MLALATVAAEECPLGEMTFTVSLVTDRAKSKLPLVWSSPCTVAALLLLNY